MYHIHLDRGTATLHFSMEGFWTRETLADFIEKFMVEVEVARRTKKDFNVLCDVRNFPVQSAEITDGLARLTEITASGGRSAIVASGMLIKLQAERVITVPNVRYFMNIEEAQAWLEKDETQAS